MSNITRRKAEEMMMRLLISQETEQDIIDITDAMSDSIWTLTYEIRHYFDTHIKPYCGKNIHKIISRLSNQKLIESFIGLFPNEDHNAYLQSLATEIKASFCKSNNINNDNKNTNITGLAIYLDHLHKNSIDKNSIDEVIGINLVFGLLSEYNKAIEPKLIKFISSLYHQGNESFRDSLIRKLSQEQDQYPIHTQRIFGLILKKNERNGAPGLVIHKMPNYLHLYEVIIILQKGNEIRFGCRLTLFQYMTVYELRILIMIKLCINIDLYVVVYKEHVLNINSDMYIKPIEELFTIRKDSESSTCMHHSIRLTIRLRDSLLNNFEGERYNEYYDTKVIKDKIKGQLKLLFIYFRNKELHLNDLFSFDIFEQSSKPVSYTYDLFLSYLKNRPSNQTNEEINSYLLLHLLIGFRHGNLEKPYLRNVHPNDLIRNQIKKVTTKYYPLLDKEIQDFQPFSQHSHYYYLLFKTKYNASDTIYNNTADQAKTITDIQTSIIDQIFAKDINVFKYSFKYKLLFKYCSSLFKNIPDDILLKPPNVLWFEKYYCKIWIDILLNIDTNTKRNFNVKDYLLYQCSSEVLTIDIITKFSLKSDLINVFNFFSSKEGMKPKEKKQLDSLELFKAFLGLINENNMKQVLNENILLFYLSMTRSIEKERGKYQWTQIMSNSKYESLYEQFTDKSFRIAEVSLYTTFLYLGFLHLDKGVFNTLNEHLVNKLNFEFKGISSNNPRLWPINHLLILLYHCHQYFNYNKIKDLILIDSITLETVLYLIIQSKSLNEVYNKTNAYLVKHRHKSSSDNDINDYMTNDEVIDIILSSINLKKHSSTIFAYYHSNQDDHYINSISLKAKESLIVSRGITGGYKMIGCIKINRQHNDNVTSVCFDYTTQRQYYYSNSGTQSFYEIDKDQREEDYLHYYFYKY